MASFRIPYDVLEDVFAFLDRRSLVSVCLVNKLFNFAATRTLYGREITLNARTSKWKISQKYASMVRTIIWIETGHKWLYSSTSKHLIQQPFPTLPGLRAFRWFGASTRSDLLIQLFMQLTKIDTLQEITLPSQHWDLISNSEGWKEALDRSRVVQLGGLPMRLLDRLSARVLQRLTIVKEPFASRRSADICQLLVLVTHLRDLELEQHFDLGDEVKVFEIVGRLRSLQTLRLTFRYWTSGGDITMIDASLPHLRHFSLAIRRHSGTSTKNVAYLVKTLTADAALETLNLQCDYKGWDTPTIYRAIKRHSKTLQVLCAPGWYAHTAMLQALDKFTVLEEVTIGRFLHLEVDVLRDFKRIQKVYLYNHQHSLPLSTSEVKMLLLQSESSIHTFGESVYTDKVARIIDIWRTHWTYDSSLERPRRSIVRDTQKALDSAIIP